MRYADFLEATFRAIRDAAPKVWQSEQFDRWLLSIGEVLRVLPPALQASWIDRYTMLLMVTYGTVPTALAQSFIWNSLKHACLVELTAQQAELDRAVADTKRKIAELGR